MKTALKIVGGIFVLLLIAIVAIPFFVDVNQYRPQIVQKANENINGTLELGELSLSLWGKIHVGINGLKLTDAAKREVINVKDAAFDLPFTSILSGSPLVTLSMTRPQITVIKDKDGKMNVMTLVKTQPGQAAAPGAGPKSEVAGGTNGKVAVPGLVANAHVGISITDAKLVYKDAAMQLTNTVDNLNLRVKDFSLTRKTDIELWADLKTQMGTDTKVEGPLKLTAELSPELSGGEFKSASVSATFSADDLLITKGDLFTKKQGVPTNFRFNGSLDQSSLKLKEATLKFHNAEVVVSGVFHKENGADFKFDAKPVDLKPWSELIPMLKEYDLSGTLGLSGGVKGQPQALAYNAKMIVGNFSMKGPYLKAKPVINATVNITTDKIEKFLVDLKGPGNEVTLDGKLTSFTAPNIQFTLNSPRGLDLDQWIEFPKTEPAKKSAPAESKGTGGGGGGQAAADDYDGMLDPLRKNEIARNTTVDGNISIAFVKAKGVRIDDIGAKFQMKNLVAALTNLRMKAYEGTMSGSFTIDMKPKEPTYSMNFTINGFNMQKAVEAQFQSLKDTLTGKLSASLQGSGASLNPVTAKKRLVMKGDFKVLNGAFKTMDIAKMANEALNGSLGKIAEKVPMLKGKNLKVNSNGGSEYEVISSNFNIQNGMLDAPNFFAKAAPKRGIDLKGTTKMGLVDESLDAKWEMIDSQRVTGADQLTVNIAGKDVHNFLARSEKDPVIIPVSVGCKWSAPCANYSQVAEYLAGVATHRLSGVATDVAKEKAMDAVKKAIPGGLPGGLKGLFGR